MNATQSSLTQDYRFQKDSLETKTKNDSTGNCYFLSHFVSGTVELGMLSSCYV